MAFNDVLSGNGNVFAGAAGRSDHAASASFSALSRPLCDASILSVAASERADAAQPRLDPNLVFVWQSLHPQLLRMPSASFARHCMGGGFFL